MAEHMQSHDAAQREQEHARPYVSVHPGVRFGRPCVRNTRLDVETVAACIWSGWTPEEVADEFGVTRADVMVACWYVGTYGIPGPDDWRARWGEWATSVHEELWHGRYDVPAPPREEIRTDG